MRPLTAVAIISIVACQTPSEPDDESDSSYVAYQAAVAQGGTADAPVLRDAAVEAQLQPAVGSGARLKHAQAAALGHGVAAERGLDEGDLAAAIAHSEMGVALLETTCKGCELSQLHHLLQLLEAQRRLGDAGASAQTLRRIATTEREGLSVQNLYHWPMLKQLSALYAEAELYEDAARIQRSLLDAHLEVVGEDHPDVPVMRHRIEQFDRRAAERDATPAMVPPP